jgi:hypothetical protein
MLSGEPFWEMLQKWKWFFFLTAITAFIARTNHWFIQPNSTLLALESNCWIFSLLAFANKYLNKNGMQLTYLKEAAYPIYIIHMAFLYFGSTLLFPLQIDASLKFILLLVFTFVSSLFFYEFLIRRINIIRPIFGLKMK